jgi:hypothetical protein
VVPDPPWNQSIAGRSPLLSPAVGRMTCTYSGTPSTSRYTADGYAAIRARSSFSIESTCDRCQALGVSASQR